MEVLYQLSYPGEMASESRIWARVEAVGGKPRPSLNLHRAMLEGRGQEGPTTVAEPRSGSLVRRLAPTLKSRGSQLSYSMPYAAGPIENVPLTVSVSVFRRASGSTSTCCYRSCIERFGDHKRFRAENAAAFCLQFIGNFEPATNPDCGCTRFALGRKHGPRQLAGGRRGHFGAMSGDEVGEFARDGTMSNFVSCPRLPESSDSTGRAFDRAESTEVGEFRSAEEAQRCRFRQAFTAMSPDRRLHDPVPRRESEVEGAADKKRLTRRS
jgi:hypothetical protein